MLKQHQSSEINSILDKLFSLQRLGIKVGLDHTYELLNRCENPHNKLKTIHIAGTNGKGSTAAMLQNILRKSGLSVGLYTSPHLVNFNERIRVNSTPISDSFIVEFMKNFNDDIDKIESTFFETTTVLAFYYFYYKKVDIAIIETGLGGRLDSTNVLNPNLTIITPIDYDHQKILGNTMNEIALEKAGVENPRPLAVANKTAGKKKGLSEYYTDEIKGKAIAVFGPFLEKYNYSFPEDWGKVKAPIVSKIQFQILGFLRKTNQKYFKKYSKRKSIKGSIYGDIQRKKAN